MGVDSIIHKFNLNFDINQAINSGDFFEIETHALPDLGSRDITASATDKTVIGKWEKIESNYGNRRYNTSNIATVADAQNIRPEVNTVYKYRAVFNDEAVKLNDISFSLGVSGGSSGGYTIADRNYTTEAWVKVNEAKIASKNIEVAGWSKTQGSNRFFVSSSKLVVDKNQASAYNGMNWQNFGINVVDGLKDSFIEVTLEDNSLVRIKDHKDHKTFSQSPSYRYDDNSTVNANGVIFTPNNMRWGFTGVELTDKKFKALVDRQTGSNFASVFWLYYELTEEGERVLAETGTLPDLKTNFKITKANGDVVYERNLTASVDLRGSISRSTSTVKPVEKPVEKTEEKIQAPEIKKSEEPKKEIKAPNTGFVGELPTLLAVLLALAGVSGLGFVAFRK